MLHSCRLNRSGRSGWRARCALIISLAMWLIVVCASTVALAADGPRRVISLAPSVTESIYWIGAEDRLCGVTTWCNYPAAADGLPRVGSYSAPSVEMVVALQPDLIIALADGTRPDILQQMQDLGLNVWICDVQSFDDFQMFVRELGHRLDILARAEASLKSMNRRLQQYKMQVSHRPPVRVIGVVQQQPLIVAAPETWPGTLMAMAGGENVVASGRFRYPHYSEEQVVTDRPEVIIETSGHTSEASSLNFWRRFPSIPAVQDRRIFVVDGDLLFRPGPRLVDGLQALIERLHPDLQLQEPT